MYWVRGGKGGEGGIEKGIGDGESNTKRCVGWRGKGGNGVGVSKGNRDGERGGKGGIERDKQPAPLMSTAGRRRQPSCSPGRGRPTS